MSYRLRLPLLTILTLIFSAAILSVEAIQFFNTDTYVLMEEETLDEETWVLATSADLQGSVNDDLFLISSNTVLNATFKDDVWAVGNVITVAGTFEESPRILGGQLVRIQGTLQNGLMAFAKTVQLSTNAILSGKSYLGGENILYEGSAFGKIYMAGTKVTLKGTIEGDLRIIADDIALMPGTSISGDVFYTSPTELVPGKGVTIGGKLIPVTLGDQWISPLAILNEGWRKLNIIFYVNALFLGIIYIVLSSRKVGHAVRCCRVRPFRAFLIGFTALFILPGLAQLLIMSQFGIPAALGIAGLYFIGLYIGKILIALLIGGMILRLKGHQTLPWVLLSYGLGLSILYLIFVIPGLGLIAWFTVCSYGLGGWVLSHLEEQILQQTNIKENLNEKTETNSNK